jgi:signal peptidase I
VPQTQPNKPMKDPWFAVNLSMFFPGLGQIYAEKPIRGLVLITIQSLFIGTGLWSIFNAEGDVLSGLIYLGFAISIYIFNLFDALLLIYYQSPEIYPERIPRKIKNTWFAVAISRVLPGLGHFYLNQSILGLILLTIALVSLRLQAFFWPLLVLTPLITAIASYHVFLSFSRTAKRSLIAIMASGIFVVGLFFNYLPISPGC